MLQSRSMTDIGIVIVSWNTREYLRRCLESVYASEGDLVFEVVVVENGSTDGSLEMVAECFPQVMLISGHGNVGYPTGNNLGLRALGYADEPGQTAPGAPRCALLLNPDTEVPPDALVNMLAYLDDNPAVGAVGPRLVLPDGSLDLACRPGPSCSAACQGSFAGRRTGGENVRRTVQDRGRSALRQAAHLKIAAGDASR